MTLRTSRLGLGFALALALPAAFASAWLWLQHGGMIERARANERAAAGQALTTAQRSLAESLQRTAAATTCALALDAARHVVGPFRSEAAPPAPVGIAERAAGAHLAAGEAAAALPFFAHAAAAGTLSPEGWLRYADQLAERDVAAAQRQLAAALAQHVDASCGSVPFALLAALREATWLLHEQAPDRQRLQQLAETMLATARFVPAGALPALAAAMCETLPALRSEPRLDEVIAAAAAACALADAAAPMAAAPGPGGSVLAPVGADRLAAVPAAVVANVTAAAIAEAAAAQPTVAVRESPAARDGDAPTLFVPALGITWTALAATMPTSALLGFTARTCLVLAIVTFVLGNLLVFRLVRRELALVRLRSDFVEAVSHELRTPLAALSLKAEMLAAGDVPAARQSHYLQALRGDVRRLADQVERILDFGRLEQGALLRRATVPARTVLARGLRAGRPSLRLVGQELEVEAPRSLPALVGDVEVLGRALRNLLENAAKYAPPGSTVSVRAFAQGQRLIVEVADRGPGVPAAERATIFQPFVRGDSTAASTPGSGLGLALVAAAVKAHGGRVEVADRAGGGAVFTLTLPALGQEAAS